MDVGINSVVQALLNVDLGQFSDSLFALGERTNPESRTDRDLEDESNDEDDESVTSVAKEGCSICGKLSSSPNNIAACQIKKCQSLLRVSGKSHYLRDDFVSSKNLEDYLRPSIWCWHPQRLLESSSAPLVCWNENCAGHSGKASNFLSMASGDHIPNLLLH